MLDNDTQTPKKYKILFYHANPHGMNSWVYPTVMVLKTYIETEYKDLPPHLEWLLPLQDEMDDEKLLDKIINQKVDILCTSHYLWNHHALMDQMSRIHKRLPSHVKVISGGPSINVNINTEFFQQYPWVDYAVYGPGEQAFGDIVTHLVFNKPLIAFNTANCAWVDKVIGKTVMAGYKFVKLIPQSPYTSQEKLFTEMIEKSNRDSDLAIFSYELTRGCPYACTFCDWNSGLGNKISRRKKTFEQEIDLFQKIGATHVYLADANIGQYDEDVEMFEYFAKKNIEENAGFLIWGNFSKTKKENNKKIFHLAAKGHLTSQWFNFSIQDTNQQILENCDRPDVGWEIHRDMARELTSTYPGRYVIAQMIYGLPGQTPSTWRQTLKDLGQEMMLPNIFLNMPLAASPAMYDKSYQEKFNFKYINSYRFAYNPSSVTTAGQRYLCLIPKSCNSFGRDELISMNLFNAIYYAAIKLNIGLTQVNVGELFPIETIVDDFLQTSQYQDLYDNLYNNWIIDNNYFYSINFSGQEEYCPDENLGNHLLSDQGFISYVARFLSPESRLQFLNPEKQQQIQDFWGKGLF
jgi:radical SAM superfamily enzyme YgiQ (UPF0313 family)